MPDFGTDRLSLQNTTGAIQNNSGDPLLSTDDSGSASYAFGPALSAGIYLGVQNGNLGAPPPNIEDAIAEDNPLPYFSITDSSSGRIVASAVADSVQASGYAIRFTMTNALSGDSIFLERVISVPASRAMTVSFQPRGAWTAATNNASFRAFTRAQYIKADGTTTTGAAGTGEATGTAIFAYTSTAREVQANPNTTGVAPTDAAFLSVKVGVRLTANIVGTATVDLVEVRLDQGRTQYILTDGDAPNSYGYGAVYQSSGVLFIQPNELGLSGSNPRVSMSAVSGNITLNAANVGANGSAVVNGDILLQPKSGGFVYIGDGSGTYDVNLYRSAANTLKTDDSLVVEGTLTGGGATTDLHHGITLQRTTTLSIGTATDVSATAIPWTSAVKNTTLYAYWSTGSTITIPLAGWYSITCHLTFASGTGYAARLYALINGTVIAETDVQAQANTFSDTFSIATLVYLAASDALVFRAAASTTGKTIGGSARNRCSVVYIGNTSA